MNIEDKLSKAWNAETGSALNLTELTAKVQQQQRHRQWQRILELLLTVLAVAIFSHAIITHSMGPTHWLLLPFFAVFLPTVWMLVLRRPRQDIYSINTATQVYAQLRMAQLNNGLGDLRLATWSAHGLLIYSVLACAGAWFFAGGAWRESALVLLVYALLWWLATMLLVHRLGQSRQREYRNLLGLFDD